MAHISVRNLTVEFKVYGSNARSLKSRLLSQATGGWIARGADDSITVKALDDVSLEIENGTRIGLVGHNGAGKTTLLRALAGIYKPTGGSIEIEGTLGALIDGSAGLDLDATGYENIFLRGYVLGLSRREIDERLDEIADFTELGEFLDLPVKTYSMGMVSRLNAAISMSINPEILLIDEGINAGDENFQKKIYARITDFFARTSILIFASHNASLVARYCRQCLVFSHGKIQSIEELPADDAQSASAVAAAADATSAGTEQGATEIDSTADGAAGAG